VKSNAARWCLFFFFFGFIQILIIPLFRGFTGPFDFENHFRSFPFFFLLFFITLMCFKYLIFSFFFFWLNFVYHYILFIATPLLFISLVIPNQQRLCYTQKESILQLAFFFFSKPKEEGGGGFVLIIIWGVFFFGRFPIPPTFLTPSVTTPKILGLIFFFLLFRISFFCFVISFLSSLLMSFSLSLSLY